MLNRHLGLPPEADKRKEIVAAMVSTKLLKACQS